ncbi:MAG: ABC transporter ATP-binding protein [Dehalococcoidia bacterium]|nr:ABC transporter ATP-binding protein [Dehalococcoidia bacterium]MDW8119597.1 ABC transporter ATP-binding protein [Chloroflexota bacterium]
MPLLEVQNLNTFYGQSHILFDVTMTVDRGEVVCLLGRNGAGKSTTLKSIIGLVPPRSGSIRFKGQEITGLPPYRIARMGIGYVPEERRIFANLSVRENLEVARRTAPPSTDGHPWDVERVLTLFPRLRSFLERRAGTLSGGEQQMLTIARTLMTNPDLLLLDEPSEGLAPVVVQALKEQLQSLKATGLTIILAEQNVRFVSGLGDRVYILEKGHIRYQAPMERFLADEGVRRAYLAV